MSTAESQKLRDGIRSGAIQCSQVGCNPAMGEHSKYCPWDPANLRIYEIERIEELT